MDINYQSMTAARGWANITSAFAGKNSRKPKVIDFLPFPDAFKGPDEKPFKEKTAALIARLIKQRKIPARIAGAFQIVDQVTGHLAAKDE